MGLKWNFGKVTVSEGVTDLLINDLHILKTTTLVYVGDNGSGDFEA